MSTPELHRGQFVTITYEGRSTKAMVLLASANGRSLMLGFDGALWGRLGAFFGALPVLQDEAGVYRDLVADLPVEIAVRGDCP